MYYKITANFSYASPFVFYKTILFNKLIYYNGSIKSGNCYEGES